MTDYVWKGNSGSWNDPANWTPTGYPAIFGDTATIDGSGSFTVSVAGGFFNPAGVGAFTLDAPNATLEIAAGSELLTTGPVLLDAGTVAGGGTFLLDDATLTLGAGETLGGARYDLSTEYPKFGNSEVTGTDVVIGADATVTGAGYVEGNTVTNDGTIYAAAPPFEEENGLDVRATLLTNVGTVIDTGGFLGDKLVNQGLVQFYMSTDGNIINELSSTTLVNDGTLAIADGARLFLTDGALGTLTFADLIGSMQVPGTLNLAGTATTSATIENFSVQDAIVFGHMGQDSFSYADHLLTLNIDGATVAEFTMENSYQAQDFTFNNGTLTTDVTCFVRGTRILTESGEIAVEALRIGDRVVTASGATRPVKWIGHRAYDGRFIAGNRNALPIRIRAGALDENVPHRDLLVSPHHAMLLDGVLIPAEHLLNGASILQEEAVESVAYFHIELDSHDVLIAEGAAAESFVDCDSRALFQNAAEFRALYPDAEPPRWRFCAERVEGGAVLERVWRRLAERAGVVTTEPGGALRGQLDTVSRGAVAGWAADDKGGPVRARPCSRTVRS